MRKYLRNVKRLIIDPWPTYINVIIYDNVYFNVNCILISSCLYMFSGKIKFLCGFGETIWEKSKCINIHTYIFNIIYICIVKLVYKGHARELKSSLNEKLVFIYRLVFIYSWNTINKGRMGTWLTSFHRQYFVTWRWRL